MAPIYVNSGIGAQIVAMLETTYGVAPTLTGSSLMSLEFDSETLELKKNVTQGKGLHAGGVFNRGSRRKLNTYETAGGITLDLPTRQINQLLMAMTGSKGNAASALVALGGGTTGVQKAVHAPGTLKGTSLTIQKGVPSVDGSAPSPFTYVGQKVSDWTITVALNAMVKLALNFNGRNELAGAGNGDPLNGSVPALATFAPPSTQNDVFFFRGASVYSGGTVTTTSGVSTVTGQTLVGNCRSADVKETFKYDTARYFLGSNGFKTEPIENDYRDITGNLEVEWLNSAAMYNAFSSDTPTSLLITLQGVNIGTGTPVPEELDILIPQIFLEGEPPKVGGPGVVVQKIPFTGLDDGTNNPIQITYITLDTV